jgi:hypothetical protein
LSIYFISGHLDTTPEELQDEYALRLLMLIHEPGSSFVVGDARGTDTWAQSFLGKHIPEKEHASRVTVFHMFDAPRTNVFGFPTVGGFTSDDERDAAMTLASTHDVAWVRPGREKSGTAKNLARRIGLLS